MVSRTFLRCGVSTPMCHWKFHKAKAKAKDFKMCPQGPSRPRTCPRGFHHWWLLCFRVSIFFRLHTSKFAVNVLYMNTKFHHKMRTKNRNNNSDRKINMRGKYLTRGGEISPSRSFLQVGVYGTQCTRFFSTEFFVTTSSNQESCRAIAGKTARCRCKLLSIASAV